MAMGSGGGGIRLRPLDIGDVLDETFKVYRRQFVALITVMGIVVIPTALITVPPALLMGISGENLARRMQETGGIATFITAFVAIFILAIVASLAHLVAAGAATLVASDAILGRPVSVANAYRQAIGRFGSFFLVSLSVGIPVGLLFITCLGIPFAVFVGVGWSLVYPAIMLEGLGAWAAMGRSWELVDGHRWRLLACLILMGLIVYLLVSIPAGLFGFLSGIIAVAAGGSPTMLMLAQIGNAIFQVVGQTLFGAIGFVTATLLYYDLRIRKEAFDLEQRLPGGDVPGALPYPESPPAYPQAPPPPPYPPYPPPNA
jgi:hypothetical protein